MTILVTKANGTREQYNESKVISSMTRAGVPVEFQSVLITDIRQHLFNGISTAEILTLIIKYLKQVYPRGQSRYQLKQAIMEMGPSGFPFEQLIGRLLHAHGYTVSTDVILWGACVSHEIDVLATKDVREYFVECKYHNQPGSRSDIKTVLYVKARGEDLIEKMVADDSKNQTHYGSWVFTNTKFSLDAITYAECKKLRVTGWSYPQKGNLQDMIESKKMYPVTCLTTLSHDQKMFLLSKKVILVSELFKDKNIVESLHLTKEQRDAIEYEQKYLTD